ncbi:MAG: hypothetical protein QM740_19680 [Acidovorax sp.]
MSTNTTSARTSVRVALSLPFAVGEVADYLLHPEVVRYWLCGDAQLRAEAGSRAVLPQATADGSHRISFGAPVTGQVDFIAWPVSAPPAGGSRNVVTYELGVALGDSPAQTHVRFRLTSRTSVSCRLRIEHSGLATELERHASVRLWQGALDRVGRLMARAQRGYRHERQAVILVHGIGEQRPGQLLRQFVANIFDEEAGELHFVKPDQLSSLFEMRMATVPRNDGSRPTTDVYELYWAHLIRDTRASQVYSWMLRLVFSRDTKIPESLLRLVWCLRVALVVALGVTAWLVSIDISAWIKGLGIGVLAALPAVGKFVLGALSDQYVIGYAGDAARYLEPRPDNIARRQEIREAGAKLLDALHDKGRYSRIVVYGHSLGSVIAYDILSHAWVQRSRRRDNVPRTSSRALRRLEALLNPRNPKEPTPPIEQIQALQNAAWQEYQKNGFQWKVSDFVTVGSPLTHATWLLNLDAQTQFEDLVRERSFPTCPPQVELVASPVPGEKRRVFTFTHAYSDAGNARSKRSVQVPHHGGLFALTRWTNLYFPYRGLYDGDPIGGALAPQFGEWAKDVQLRETKGFAHGRYTDRALEPEAVAQVRAALNLPLQHSLSDYAPKDLHPTVLN